MKFHDRLKELREDRGLSYIQLSKAIGVADTTLGRWESGKRIPNIESLILLSQFFGVSTDYLLGLKDY